VEGADALGLIAEVGIAIAGFAGVIAALRAPGGRIGAYAAARIGTLLGMSGTVVLLALLPFAMHHAGMTSTRLWTLSSAGMAAAVVLFVIVARTSLYRVAPATDEYRPPGIRWIVPLSFAWNGANVALQLANVTSIGQLWPFYVGLLALTALSLLHFAWTLLAPSRAEVPA
jgi:hypothetical protein